jgi:hypothetical protein
MILFQPIFPIEMAKQALSFKQAVEATQEIADGYRTGLSALGQYSNKIIVANTRLLNGSVDIDACTVVKYPNENRWDYALAYRQEVYFVEVHSANTSQVSTVLRKLQWLKDWLNSAAPEINKLKAQHPYYWIMSNKYNILNVTSQARRIAQKGLKPIPCLNLG